MKCPYCSKEINEDALFCGFCGKSIIEHQVENEEIKADGIKEDKTIKKKQHKGLKLLLVFCIFGFISGGVLGLLYARGFVSLSYLTIGTEFKWIPHTEGKIDIDETENDVLDDKDVETEISDDVLKSNE